MPGCPPPFRGVEGGAPCLADRDGGVGGRGGSEGVSSYKSAVLLGTDLGKEKGRSVSACRKGAPCCVAGGFWGVLQREEFWGYQETSRALKAC